MKTQYQILNEFSENAIQKIVKKFSNEASEITIRAYLKNFEKYKNGISQKDPFQYKTFTEFEQAIDAAKGKSEFEKRNLDNKSNPKRYADRQDNLSEAIAEDDNVTIFKGDEEHKCVKYGKGYSFCISRPYGGNMFGNYRLSKSSTFYFIFFKKVPKSDPKHIMVLDRTKYGWEWTFGDNNTKPIEGGFEEVVEKFPVLRKYGDIFENVPLSEEEKRYNDIIERWWDKPNQNTDAFRRYDYKLKTQIVRSGATLKNDIFDLLDTKLRNEYVSSAPNLTYIQADKLTTGEIKRFRSVREETIKYVLEEGEFGDYVPTPFDNGIYPGLSITFKLEGGNITYKINQSGGEEWDDEEYVDMYDGDGNLLKREAQGGITIMEYDNVGNHTLLKMIDDMGNIYLLERYWYYPNNKIKYKYTRFANGHSQWYDGNSKKIGPPNEELVPESINIYTMLTQKELINEGFWKNIGKTARGAYRTGKAVTKSLAPELYNPIANVKQGLKGWKSAFTRGYHGIPEPGDEEFDRKNNNFNNPSLARSVVEKINLGLEQNGYDLLPKYGFQPSGVNPVNGTKLYKVAVINRKTSKKEWIKVDSNGNPSK